MNTTISLTEEHKNELLYAAHIILLGYNINTDKEKDLWEKTQRWLESAEQIKSPEQVAKKYVALLHKKEFWKKLY